MVKINGQRVLIFLDFLKLLADRFPRASAHIKAFPESQGLKKRKGIAAKYRSL